jgi:hypothetical protein
MAELLAWPGWLAWPALRAWPSQRVAAVAVVPVALAVSRCGWFNQRRWFWRSWWFRRLRCGVGIEDGAGRQQAGQRHGHLPADRFNIGTQQAFDTRHEISSVSRMG